MTPLAPSRRVSAVWAALGVAAMAWYLGWLLQPGRPGVAWLFAALVAADLFNGAHALSFWATSLRGPRRRPFAMPASARVDVLIPTYNEPVDILRRTIRAARRMRGADVRVLLLDDGDRAEMAELALLEGAHYIAREDHAGAKSGNLNHALRATAEGGAEFVCVFDADHAADERFLEETLGFFADEDVALVQTPQVYGNAAAGPISRAAAEQQAIFFGPICAGKDGFDAAFCCGTNFVARRAALEEVGNFPEDSITEDIVMSIRLVGRGHKIVYVPVPLSVGLGPEDAESYLKQQHRWAAGCLDLLLRQPSAWRGLSWGQRWQYLVSTSYWLTGWTLIVYLTLPLARLFFDVPVVTAAPDEFALHFMPYFVLAVVSLGRFTAGAYSIRGIALNWGCFFVHIKATLAVLAGRPGGFAVTSKRALGGIPLRALAPNLAVAVALVAATAVGVARELSPAVLANVAFAVLNTTLASLIVVFAVVQARRITSASAQTDPLEPEAGTELLPFPVPAVRAAGGRFARDGETAGRTPAAEPVEAS